MMKLLWEYIKIKKKSLVYFALYILVFTGVFTLYKLPFDALIYAVILCAFLGIIVAVYDFSKFVRRHRMLERAIETVSDSLDELPSAENLVDEDYFKLVRTISEDKEKIKSLMDGSYKDMIDYFTMWAHQIKTPIAAMRLILQDSENVMAELTDGPEDSEKMMELYSSTKEVAAELFRIEQYVDMVLYYLRSGSDTTDYVIKRYEADKIIRVAIRKYAGQFIRKKLYLKYEGTTANILTDEKWLSFVIEQLFANAIKYTEKGGVTVSVLDESNKKYISITDTGIGIAAEDLPRVFQKGYTGYNGRSDKKSTGIGLYLCNKIIRKLGHKIEIFSEVGKGTKVVITINDSRITLND